MGTDRDALSVRLCHVLGLDSGFALVAKTEALELHAGQQVHEVSLPLGFSLVLMADPAGRHQFGFVQLGALFSAEDRNRE
ncbi:hypothetical protein QYE80_16670 [Pseudomonas tohonis]|uniref:hypothetical protein n=1 Tax=Pseudomonas solani TaxID=2731552 RepID=UPI000397C6D0|nr:hypothetical protein L682_07340 [Pseudomonas alcaligenes OT 69]MDN4146628.1 hypothetical protein [Pseudomonas tohonis]